MTTEETLSEIIEVQRLQIIRLKKQVNELDLEAEFNRYTTVDYKVPYPEVVDDPS